MMAIEYSYGSKLTEIVEPPKKVYKQRKYWLLAKRRYNNQDLILSNSNTEHAFHMLLKDVKKLYATRMEYVYERDFKHNRENLFTMHEFQCASLYLNLWCCFSEYYFVDYDFNNCPFEEEISLHFSRGMLKTQSRHFPIDADSFDHTKQSEDKRYFSYL